MSGLIAQFFEPWLAYDSGFRHTLTDIRQIRKPKQESAGLRYIVIQEGNNKNIR